MDEKGLGMGKELINEWPRHVNVKVARKLNLYSWLDAIASGLSMDMPFP